MARAGRRFPLVGVAGKSRSPGKIEEAVSIESASRGLDGRAFIGLPGELARLAHRRGVAHFVEIQLGTEEPADDWMAEASICSWVPGRSVRQYREPFVSIGRLDGWVLLRLEG